MATGSRLQVKHAPEALWHMEARDERGWLFAVVVDLDCRTATIVLNDVLQHCTPLDDDGYFLSPPRWLPAQVRAELEQRMGLWVRQAGDALRGGTGVEPT